MRIIDCTRLATAIAIGLLAACAAQPNPSVGPAVASGSDLSHSVSDYVIGPGDRLSIFVYQSPTLSVQDLPVRPDGRISVPLVPDVQAAGKTPTQLGTDMEAALKQYVKDPTVTVMVHSFVGPFDRQVRVIGEAAEPQALPYTDHLTVLDVMIATKGLTKYAAGNSAIIVRKVAGRQETVKLRLSDLLRDGDIKQNVEMRPGDTLIIPQSWF